MPNDRESAMIASTEIESMNDLPQKHEQRNQIEEGEYVLINLGTDEDKKEIKIGAELSNDEKQELHKLLKEYIDVFAWSYTDM